MQCKIKSPSDDHIVTFSLDEAFLKLGRLMRHRIIAELKSPTELPK